MWGNEADRKHRLEEILQREDHENDADIDSNEQAKDNIPERDEDMAAAQATAEGFCVECKDQESFYSCEQCAEDFCEVCYGKTIDRSTSATKKTSSPRHAAPHRLQPTFLRHEHSTAHYPSLPYLPSKGRTNAFTHVVAFFLVTILLNRNVASHW